MMDTTCHLNWHVKQILCKFHWPKPFLDTPIHLTSCTQKLYPAAVDVKTLTINPRQPAECTHKDQAFSLPMWYFYVSLWEVCDSDFKGILERGWIVSPLCTLVEHWISQYGLQRGVINEILLYGK